MVVTSIPTTGDSADLLVTCAGSGVTMVAIIAGFTLSRYLAIQSEIDGAEALLSETNDRHTKAVKRVNDARLVRDRAGALYGLRSSEDARAWVLVDAETGTTRESGDLTEAMRHIAELSNLNPDDRVALYEEWLEEARRVHASDVWSAFKVASEHDQPDWSEFRPKLPHPLGIEALWYTWFSYQRDRHITKYEKQEEARREAARFPRPTINPMPRIFVDDPDRNLNRGEVVDSAQRELEFARQDAALAESEMHVAQTRLTRVAQPSGAELSILWLLLVFALTAVPSLLLLTPEPASLSYSGGVAVLGAYFVGVGTMFYYFFTVARGLRPSPDGTASRRS